MTQQHKTSTSALLITVVSHFYCIPQQLQPMVLCWRIIFKKCRLDCLLL